MLDDNRDKDLQRNQVVAIVVMTLLVVGWSYFFLPRPSPPQPDTVPAPPQSEQAGESRVPETAEEPDPIPVEPDPDTAAPPAEAAWPELPPPAGAAQDPVDEVSLANGHLELVFTRIGGRLKYATALLGDDGADSVQLVPDWGDTPDAEAVYPFGLRFQSEFLGDQLDERRWEALLDEASGTVTFTLMVPDKAKITKTFRLTDAPYTLDLTVDYSNLEGEVRRLGLDVKEPAFSVSWGPNVNSGDENKGIKQEVIFSKGETLDHHATAKWKPDKAPVYVERTLDLDWLAIRSAYFVVGIKPEFENASGWTWGTSPHFRAGVGAPRVEVQAGETLSRGFRVYLGPNKGSLLAVAWPGLDTVWAFFNTVKFMDYFAKLLLGVMNWFHGTLIPNYGLALIFVTLLVRGVMFPLTLKSMKSMKRMQKLAPKLQAIKEEVGDDQQELQKRTMELYREHGVSPLGGCVPLLLQMPVFIAFYRMIWSAFELRRAPFMLWMQDLSTPDRLVEFPFTIPLPMGAQIDSLNLLPILMGLAMVVSQKLMPASGPVQNPQQKMMMTLMPVLFSVICYNMASGVSLYILTSTLLGIGQNYVVNASDIDVEPKKPKKPLTRSKHFYTAAQARKRQLAKEIRQDKKRKSLRRSDPRAKSTGKKRP